MAEPSAVLDYYDPTGGAILAGGLPQDTTVYDLIARGYNPGSPSAFFNLLPSLTQAPTIPQSYVPAEGYYPVGDYSYLEELRRLQEQAEASQAAAGLGFRSAGAGLEYLTQTATPPVPSGITLGVGDQFTPGYNPFMEGGGIPMGGMEAATWASGAPDLSGIPMAGVETYGDVLGSGVSGLGGLSDTLGGAASTIGESLPYLNYIYQAYNIINALANGASMEEIAPTLISGGLTTAGTILAPGIGTLFGALAGGIIGEQFGPSRGWITFPERLGRTVSAEQRGIQDLSRDLASAKNQNDVYEALVKYRGTVGTGFPYGGTGRVTGDTALERLAELDPRLAQASGENPDGGTYGLSPSGKPIAGPGSVSDPEAYDYYYGTGNDAVKEYLRSLNVGDLLPAEQLFTDLAGNLGNAIPDLPGATGGKHEGKLEFDPSNVTQLLRDQLLGTVTALNTQEVREPSLALARSLTEARSLDDLGRALSSFYAGVGSPYGAGAPNVSSFGRQPSEDLLRSTIPDIPGLSDQTVTQALRAELGSAYSGIVNRTNPFTGRQGLPVPTGAATRKPTGTTAARLSTGQQPSAEGSALLDETSFS